jgi:hypothetical protein
MFSAGFYDDYWAEFSYLGIDISDDFKELFTAMFQENQSDRPTLLEINDYAWV